MNEEIRRSIKNEILREIRNSELDIRKYYDEKLNILDNRISEIHNRINEIHKGLNLVTQELIDRVIQENKLLKENKSNE